MAKVTITSVEIAKVENVFICPNDDTVIVVNKTKQTCPVCEEAMENMGWFESKNDCE